MKKLSRFLITAFIFAGLFAVTGCGSTDADETVISSVEAKHIKVDVTKSNVKVTLTKAENENIEKIDVIENSTGSITTVGMKEPSVSFIWPFAEGGKEYTLCAKIYGDKTSEEYVSFKIEDEFKPVLDYSDAYKASMISLVAKGNKRYLTLETPYSTFSSFVSKAKATNVDFELSIYSGKHYKASASDSELVGKVVTSFSGKGIIEQYIKGIDIIEESYRFDLTPSQMNAKLSKRKTYFAVASVSFRLPDYPEYIRFTSPGVYSNDTIYTPLSKNEIPESKAAGTGDAK
jgi:hypothetical protein